MSRLAETMKVCPCQGNLIVCINIWWGNQTFIKKRGFQRTLSLVICKSIVVETVIIIETVCLIVDVGFLIEVWRSVQWWRISKGSLIDNDRWTVWKCNRCKEKIWTALFYRDIVLLLAIFKVQYFITGRKIVNTDLLLLLSFSKSCSTDKSSGWRNGCMDIVVVHMVIENKCQQFRIVNIIRLDCVTVREKRPRPIAC